MRIYSFITALAALASVHPAWAQTYSNRADAATRSVYVTSGGTNTVGFAGANYAPRIGEYQSRGAARRTSRSIVPS